MAIECISWRHFGIIIGWILFIPSTILLLIVSIFNMGDDFPTIFISGQIFVILNWCLNISWLYGVIFVSQLDHIILLMQYFKWKMLKKMTNHVMISRKTKKCIFFICQYRPIFMLFALIWALVGGFDVFYFVLNQILAEKRRGELKDENRPYYIAGMSVCLCLYYCAILSFKSIFKSTGHLWRRQAYLMPTEAYQVGLF